jgi:hypothetical protein
MKKESVVCVVNEMLTQQRVHLAYLQADKG